jgi:mannosyltransferase
MKLQSWPEHYPWMLAILLLAFLLRIACLDAQSLWWDEALSVEVGSMNLLSLLENRLNIRNHAPLFFLVLHYWLVIGRNEFVVRALSVIFGVSGVAGMFALANLVGGKKLGIIGAFALAISPFHIWYSQEVRMYSLAVFLILLIHYFFLRLLHKDKRKYWLGYGVFTLAALYTHYISLFIIVAQMTYLTLMRERHRALLGKWLLCMAIVGLLYTPWLIPVFLRGGLAGAPISWIQAAHPEDLFWTIYDFGLGSTSDSTHPLNILAALLLTAILAYISFRLLRGSIATEQRNKLWFIWLWLMLPLVLILLISLDWPLPQKRSVYMDRYLIPLMPAFLILICYGIMQVFQRKKALGILITVPLLTSVSVSIYSIFCDQRYNRDEWRQAITEIRDNARSGDILLVRPHHYVPLYYYDLQEIPWHTVPYLASKQEYETFLNGEIPTTLGEDGRLWTMIACENDNPHGFIQGMEQRLMEKVEKDEIRAWLLQNYKLLDERVYRGVYLASYGNR